MKLKILLAFLLAVLLTSTDCLTARAADSEAGQGWKFEQHSSIEGNVTLIVGKSGIKLLCPQQNLVCICTAPKWNTILINTKTQKGMDFSPAVWKCCGFHLLDKQNGAAAGKERPEKWKGMSAIGITQVIKTGDPLRQQIEYIYRGAADRAATPKSDEMLFSNWIKLKPQMTPFLCGLYRLPQTKNILLRRVEHYASGRADVVLDTTNCQQVVLSSSEFVPPVKYRKVTERSLVTSESKQRTEMVGVVEDLFTEGKPKPHDKTPGAAK